MGEEDRCDKRWLGVEGGENLKVGVNRSGEESGVYRGLVGQKKLLMWQLVRRAVYLEGDETYDIGSVDGTISESGEHVTDSDNTNARVRAI